MYCGGHGGGVVELDVVRGILDELVAPLGVRSPPWTDRADDPALPAATGLSDVPVFDLNPAAAP
jgi:hypothetical protein